MSRGHACATKTTYGLWLNNNMRDKVNNYGIMIKPTLFIPACTKTKMPEFNTHEMISRIPWIAHFERLSMQVEKN